MYRKEIKMHYSVFDNKGLGKYPESIDPVNLSLVCGEIIFSMIDNQVLSRTNTNKAIVAEPAIGIDDVIQADLSLTILFNMALEQLKTISVCTLQLRLKVINTMVFL